MLLDQGPRIIHWIYDLEGNKGKTELWNFLSQYYSAIVLSDGKSQDIAHCYGNEKLVLFDYTRDNEECINYNVLEGFKNGRLWSPKYDSSVKVFLPPKVMCFANFLPRLSGLSMDRWNIYDLDDKDNALHHHDLQRNWIQKLLLVTTCSKLCKKLKFEKLLPVTTCYQGHLRGAAVYMRI